MIQLGRAEGILPLYAYGAVMRLRGAVRCAYSLHAVAWCGNPRAWVKIFRSRLQLRILRDVGRTTDTVPREQHALGKRLSNQTFSFAFVVPSKSRG